MVTGVTKQPQKRLEVIKVTQDYQNGKGDQIKTLIGYNLKIHVSHEAASFLF